MRTPNFARWLVACAVVPAMVLGSGCSGLLPKAVAPPLFYALDGVPRGHLRVQPPATTDTAPTLIVNPTRAAAGYDSQHIVYVRVAHRLERFAHSEWVDTPARMLAPLIVSAIESTGSFRAIGPALAGIAGDLRLDTELLRLQQEFGNGPSRVRITLRATLSDNVTRQVVSWREFDQTVASASEDPYGGVVAANRAVQLVMDQLSSYCALASEPWRASTGTSPKPAEQSRVVR